jgi:predicted Zn-dependent peptidase
MPHHALTLKNGVRTHLIPFAGTEAATLLVLCKVGSRYEYPAINGASHFIEHLMFKGTKKRPRTLDISRALDSVGAEYNAYTGKDLTGYYVKVDGRHLALAIDILHDMLFHSRYAPAEVKRERTVIMEEINMYHDNPIMHVEDLLETAMFDGNTLGWEIAGSHETMRTMMRSAVIAYRDLYYIPSRLVIAVAGKLDERTRGLLEKTFGSVKDGHREAKEFTPFGTMPSKRTPRARVQFKDTKQIQIALGFPSFGVSDSRDVPARVLAMILGGTMSSRLFVAVRERRGLAYMVRASHSPYEDTGNFMIQAGLDKARLDLAIKTIFNELRSIKKKGPTASELKLAKDYAHGKFLLQLEDSSDRAEFYARQELFLGRAEDPAAYLKKISRVTAKEAQKVANEILEHGRLSVAGIGPFKDSAALLKHVPAV